MLSNTARFALLLAGFACSGDDDRRTRTLENTGDVSLSPRDGGGTNVFVLIDRCGGYCDEVEASCNASLVNGAILVESKAVATSEGHDPCPGACAVVSTACVLPELPAGTYQLHHGTGSGSVTLPVSTRTQVTGEPYPSPPS
jgi:hypothetical protein